MIFLRSASVVNTGLVMPNLCLAIDRGRKKSVDNCGWIEPSGAVDFFCFGEPGSLFSDFSAEKSGIALTEAAAPITGVPKSLN